MKSKNKTLNISPLGAEDPSIASEDMVVSINTGAPTWTTPRPKKMLQFSLAPHTVIVNIRYDNDYIRVLLYSYYHRIAGWGGPPKL